MENVKTEWKGKQLTITIDSTIEGRLSSSGKNKLFSTTSGFTDVGNGVKLSLNAIRKV